MAIVSVTSSRICYSFIPNRLLIRSGWLGLVRIANFLIEHLNINVKSVSGGTNYIRIYDSPGKVGWFKYEYGQKHPCNQGFQKVIKTVAPGLVQYANDPDAKSYACGTKIRYSNLLEILNLKYYQAAAVLQQKQSRSL